jgi:hypothetical protein
VASASAAAQGSQESAPVRAEVLRPVTVKEGAARAGVAATAAPSRIRGYSPFTMLGRMNSPEMKAIKQQARSDRRVQPMEQALSLATPQSIAATVTQSFHGMTINDGVVGNFGSVPPDPNVAASPNRVIHVVNLGIRMFTRTGTIVQTKNLNQFFNRPVASNGVSNLSDPKIIYDVNGPRNRFYIAIIESNVVSGTENEEEGEGAIPRPGTDKAATAADTGASHDFSTLHLAVSRSPNPSNLNPANWCFYHLDARLDRGTSLVNWADFPSMAAGKDALVITNNQFTFSDFSFVTSAIRVFRKLPLSNNAESCPSAKVFTFRGSNQLGDPGAFTVQPVQHLTATSSFSGTSNPVYMISSTFTAATSVPTKTYRVYRIRNVAGTPSLNRTTVTGNYAYFVPPNIPQNNSDGAITTNDDRVEEAAGVGDAFWATQATACSFATGNVSCARVIRVRVGQSAGGAFQASITQQKTFGASGDFLFEPGLAVNTDETVAVPFHFASPTRTNNNLSTWWAIKAFNETDYSPLRTLVNGNCQQVVSRTGDYAGAETDPVDPKSFWLTGEAARPIASFGGACLWTTQIIRVTPAGAAAVAAAKPGQ